VGDGWTVKSENAALKERVERVLRHVESALRPIPAPASHCSASASSASSSSSSGADDAPADATVKSEE
jgi:hypothetical protein